MINSQLKAGEITDEQLEQDKKNAIMASKAKNMTTQNFRIAKDDLNNFPASIVTFTTEVKSQTTQIFYRYKPNWLVKRGIIL